MNKTLIAASAVPIAGLLGLAVVGHSGGAAVRGISPAKRQVFSVKTCVHTPTPGSRDLNRNYIPHTVAQLVRK